jgi:molecular chaperone HtpG
VSLGTGAVLALAPDAPLNPRALLPPPRRMSDTAPIPSLPTPALQTTQVHLDGLFDVLAKHLYSTPVVAVRELIQNAHDSISRRRLEDPSFTEAGRIDVLADEAAQTLVIRDNGSGLTEQELHRYLATLGNGYTRQLRASEKAGSDELIGLFGLGFLSAFVVAEQVVVDSTSYQTPGEGWRYRSSDGRRYVVQAVDARPVGTEIHLAMRSDFNHLCSAGVLKKVLGRYCALLREPLWFDDECVNAEPPPWRATADGVVVHPTVLQRQRMAFAARMERHFEPICVIPVEPGGDSDARGLLWVQDGATYGTSDNRHLSVYVRGMLLDDEARDLLPVWAGFIGGVIESNALTPTASREDLQRDEAYQATRAHLQDALIRGLAELSRSQASAWSRLLARHNEALLGAALCEEELFAMLADAVRLPTSQGDLPVRSLVREGRIHLSLGQSGGFEDVLFRALQVPVARGDRYAVAGFLRQWVRERGVQLIEIGTAAGNARMFRADDLPEGELAWLREQLAWGELVVPARFLSPELPLIAVPDREAQLKARLDADDAKKRMAGAALSLARAFTQRIDASVSARLYVNLDNPAIQALLQSHREGRAVPAHAVALLRSFKAIMAPGGEELKGQPPLVELLDDFSQAVAALCAPPAAS